MVLPVLRDCARSSSTFMPGVGCVCAREPGDVRECSVLPAKEEVSTVIGVPLKKKNILLKDCRTNQKVKAASSDLLASAA